MAAQPASDALVSNLFSVESFKCKGSNLRSAGQLFLGVENIFTVTGARAVLTLIPAFNTTFLLLLWPRIGNGVGRSL